MSKFEEINSCDLCGSKKYKTFLVAPDLNYQTGTFTYVICQKCGLIWLSPRPASTILEKYSPVKKYRPYRPIRNINPIQKLTRKLIKANTLFAKMLVKDQLFFFSDKGKILDVGPGSGYYLKVLESWGWQVYGLELNRQAIRLAKAAGVKNIKQGDLLSARYQSSMFSVVRFSHVMEHVPSPKREVRETKRILKRGGHIIIIIPNIDSLFFKIFRNFWYPLEPPRHFYQFTPKTITALLKSQGFDRIRISYNQSPHTFLWSLLYSFGFKNIDKRFPLLTYPLTVLLRVVNLLKMSDVIEVTARKS